MNDNSQTPAPQLLQKGFHGHDELGRNHTACPDMAPSDHRRDDGCRDGRVHIAGAGLPFTPRVRVAIDDHDPPPASPARTDSNHAADLVIVGRRGSAPFGGQPRKAGAAAKTPHQCTYERPIEAHLEVAHRESPLPEAERQGRNLTVPRAPDPAWANRSGEGDELPSRPW